MSKNIILTENINVSYFEGRIYVTMHEYLNIASDNLLLQEMLKDVCLNGVSNAAVDRCGLSESLVSERQHLTP